MPGSRAGCSGDQIRSVARALFDDIDELMGIKADNVPVGFRGLQLAMTTLGVRLGAMTPTAEDAAAASQGVGAFWQSLAEDDDLAALQATGPEIHVQYGTEAGFAGRLRDAAGITTQQAARIGVSSKVRVVRGTMVFLCLEVDPEGPPLMIGQFGPELRHAWPLEAGFVQGRWAVHRFYVGPQEWPEGTDYLDLPHAPPPASGVN